MPMPSRACAEAETAEARRDLGTLLERAAQIPLDIAESAVDVASLAAVVAERGDQALRADAVAAALLAQGAARAAATLVEVNLGTTSVGRARDAGPGPGRYGDGRRRARAGHARVGRTHPEGRKRAPPPSVGRNDRQSQSRGTRWATASNDTAKTLKRGLRRTAGGLLVARWEVPCRGRFRTAARSSGRMRPAVCPFGGNCMGYRK